MKFEKKQKIIYGLILFLLLWPFLHRILVSSADMSKWNFMGWAMYVEPRPRIHITNFALPPVARGSEKHRQIQTAIQYFFRELRAYGNFYRIENLAEDIFEIFNSLPSFSISFDKLQLEASSGRIMSKSYQYKCMNAKKVICNKVAQVPR